MLAIFESFPSRETSVGNDKSSIEDAYIITGTSDDTLARSFLAMSTPTVRSGLLREQLTLKETAPGTWECKIRYGTQKAPEAGDWKWEFDTTGGTQKITQSKENIGNYSVTQAKPAPDFKGAIGVTDDSVEGCEITVPQFKWTETHQLDAASVTWSYSQTVRALTGKTNSSSFRGFGAKEVLFMGAKGSASAKAANIVEMTFSFAANEDGTSLKVGDITVPTKKAWDYLWVRYGSAEDTTAKKLVKRPTSAHVERVYDAGDFSQLGIGN